MKNPLYSDIEFYTVVALVALIFAVIVASIIRGC
jgi:hypothetical protein